MGYPFLVEEQPWKPQGYFEALLTIDAGMRQNAAKAFMGKVKQRKNLYVAQHADVLKIILERTTKTAKGVEVKIGENVLKLYAEKEVVLSAGSIGSPQILMLSGIGPEKHLKSIDIEPIINLPVGRNLQDHTLFVGFSVKLPEYTGKPSITRKALNDFFEYFMFKSGFLASNSLIKLVGFINTRNDTIYPNIQFHHVFNDAGDISVLSEFLRAIGDDGHLEKTTLDVARHNAVIYICPTLLNPKSRGHILLNSRHATDKPLIYSGYFTDKNQEDMDTMLQGIR